MASTASGEGPNGFSLPESRIGRVSRGPPASRSNTDGPSAMGPYTYRPTPAHPP